MFELFNLRVSESWVQLLHGYHQVKVALIDTSFGDIPLFCCYVELEQIVKPYNHPLVWHLDENCKIRELRIWKPRKDSNTVIKINVELIMKSIEHL